MVTIAPQNISKNSPKQKHPLEMSEGALKLFGGELNGDEFSFVMMMAIMRDATRTTQVLHETLVSQSIYSGQRGFIRY